MALGRSGRIAQFAATLMLCFPVAASAAPNKHLPTEAQEQYEDPPIYVFRLGASPAMLAKFGAFTSVQVNVDAQGHNITGDAANEPSISVSSTDHNKMVIGWRQFDSVASNFRQAGWGYTNNGGASWTFPGVLERNVFRSDPVMDSDITGKFFYLSLLQNFAVDIWRSINGGANFTRLAPAQGGDKQWVVIDKTNSIGHGFYYQTWSTGSNTFNGRQFTRSTNGGATWSNPVFEPNGPSFGTIDVDSTGNVFVAGANLDTSQIWCDRSTNAKNGKATPTFDLSVPVNFGGEFVFGQTINPEGLVGQVNVAADHSGTSTNNYVYLLTCVQPTGFSTGTDVVFARSIDGGRTFSAPHTINDDPVDHTKWRWLGALAVAPNGRIDVVWLDTRYPANNTDSQLFYSYSKDGGSSWAPNVPVSAPFNPFLGYPNQNKLGDYLTIVSDNTGGDVAYPATYNSEEDIYYVRVAPLNCKLLNISARARVLTDDRVSIAGFIITGTAPKQIVIRGLGPSLSSANLSGLLADPTLELHQGNTVLATNDNWKTKPDGSSQQAQVEATTLQPGNDLESVIVTTLNPGAYSAILSGKNGGTGIGQVEVFDLSAGASSNLANISTRSFVDTNDNVLIGGVIVGAGNNFGARVVVRAVGPSLSGSVQSPLGDPTLELHDGNGAIIATNDNWKVNEGTQQSQEAEVRATTLQPTSDLESVIVTSLSPGGYSAIVRGKNNTTGVALVEVFNLPD